MCLEFRECLDFRLVINSIARAEVLPQQRRHSNMRRLVGRLVGSRSYEATTGTRFQSFERVLYSTVV